MLNNWDAAMWFRFGTLIAAVLTALGVLLGVWLSWSDGREHDARLERIEMLAKQNTKDIAVLTEQQNALFDRQDDVLDRFDDAATKAEAEKAVLEAEIESLKRDREQNQRIATGEKERLIIQRQVGANTGEIDTLKASFDE